MTYYSKHDLWLGILLLGTTGLGAASVLIDTGISIGSLVMIAIFAFTCWIWFGTYYKVDEDQLLVVSGPFRSRASISNITTIKPSRNPLSSPACSLDRIELRGKGVYYLLSPRDKTAFIVHLQRVNPKIEFVKKKEA